ncbi:MAG: hypothetical protein Kow0077_04870 [Anaerolineae bacterium]
MTIIDHRVLVNASPEAIWALLGDLNATYRWYVNCTKSSILTTQQEGPGTRYRLEFSSGPDLVQEIRSWHRNLGFEYTVVDGPFDQNRGRIRLQAIPEGTIVHWTLEYELKGLGAAVRNVALRRRLDTEIEKSLKRLKKMIEASGARMDESTRERVSLRPAPSAEERASIAENAARTQQAMPRVEEAQPPTPPEPQPVIIDEGDIPPVPDGQPLVIDEGDLPPLPITEPALDPEDTRPNPAATGDETLPARPAELADTLPDEESTASAAPDEEALLPESAAAEPDEIETIPEPLPPVDLEATQPADSEMLSASETIPAVVPVAEDLQVENEPDLAAEPEAEPQASTTPEGAENISPAEPPPEPATQEPVAPEPSVPPAPARHGSILEAEVQPIGPSIWEVFGMKPPSADESEEAAASQAVEAPASGTDETPPQPAINTNLAADFGAHFRRIHAVRRGRHPGLRALHAIEVTLRPLD